MRAAAFIAPLALLLCTSLPSAWAQPTPPATGDSAQPTEEQETEGRQLARDGFAAYKNNDYAMAVEKFEQARTIYPTGQVLRMTGYSLLALERWAAAADALEASIDAQYKPLDDADRQQAQEQLQKAVAHLGIMRVTSAVPGATVRIDNSDPVPVPFELRLEPGRHTIVVSADDHTDAKQSVDIEAGERADLNLDPTESSEPEPPPPPPPPPPEPETASEAWFPHQRMVGGIIGATGLAATVAGVATLISGYSLRGTVEDNVTAHNEAFGEDCSRADYSLCYTDAELINRDGSRAKTMQDAGLGLTIGGGTLLAAGAVLFFMAPWDDDESAEPSEDPMTSTGPEPDAARIACGPFATLGIGCGGAF